MDETDTIVREVTITRVFDAPRDAVWTAWTDAEQLKQWFMPHGFTVPECTVDLRPGGVLHMVIHVKRNAQGNLPNARMRFRKGDSASAFAFSASTSRTWRSISSSISCL